MARTLIKPLLCLCTAVATMAFSAKTPMFLQRSTSDLNKAPLHPCRQGEQWPRPPTPRTRQDEITERRLDSRVRYLENLLQDLCSVIVYSDDMALVERQALQAGEIYLDLSSNMTRTPLLLRRAVADIARLHGKPVQMPERLWH